MTNIIESRLSYFGSGKSYDGLMLQGDGAAPIAAVVLMPDWQGQSQLARDHARLLVDAGCAVLIADLYGDGFSPTDPGQVGPMVKRLMDNREEGVVALASCIGVLRKHVGSKLAVFCLGYSAGGMIALDSGRSGVDVAGIILCSALLKTAASGMSTHVGVPILILQGTQDVVSPLATISEVIAEMDKAGNDFRIELYGQTHHAFDNPQAGTDPTARLAYSPASAKLAQRAIAAFIKEHAVESLSAP